MDLPSETTSEPGAAPETPMAEAAAPEAVETGSQPETDNGSASSAEAPDTRSHAEKVRDAFLEKYGEPEPAKAAEPEPEPQEQSSERQEDVPEGKVRLTDQEWKALPQRAQRRINEMHRELKMAQEAASKAEDYRSDYEAMNKLRDFAERAQLSGNDISSTLNMASHLKAGRFKEFLDAVMPLVTTAQQALGEAVSPDIQAMIDNGEITEAAARRLTQAESGRRLAETTAAHERMARETTSHQTQHEARVNAIISQARQTSIELRAEDPDYARKEPAITAQIKRMLNNGARIPDEKAMDRLIREIHKDVVLPPAPKPLAATNPHPTASTVTRPLPPPKTALEAITRFFENGPVAPR